MTETSSPKLETGKALNWIWIAWLASVIIGIGLALTAPQISVKVIGDAIELVGGCGIPYFGVAYHLPWGPFKNKSSELVESQK